MKLTLTALFIAIIAVMCFTPLGYLKVGMVEITLICIPVAAGAALLGKAGGTVLGLAFGVSSFLQCFGMSAFGAAILAVNPVLAGIICIVPRVAVGFFSALIFEKLEKAELNSAVGGAVTFLSASLINTVGFVGLLVLLMGKSEYITTMMQGTGAKNLLVFAFIFAGTNSLIEAAASLVTGSAVGAVLSKLRKTKRP